MNRGVHHLLRLIYRYHHEQEELESLLNHFKREYNAYGEKVHPLLWIMLDAMRVEAGEPIHITSHFRHNSTTTHGGDPSGTTPALGVDIRCWQSRPRFRLVRAAYAVGFTRIGQYCDDGHIHVDIGDLVDTSRWAYEVHWLPGPRGSNPNED